MQTRKQYMDGECTHREFYADVAQRAGITVRDDHPLVERARNSNDEHYNDIPIVLWDRFAAGFMPSASRSLRESGDFWSLAGGVCIGKEVVRQAVERVQAKASE